MPYQIITLEEARLETLEAYNYYEDKQRGLGEAFLEEVEKKYTALSMNPYLFGYVDNQGPLRDVKVGRFPYLIIFEIGEAGVVVLSLHNTYKQPYKF